LDDVALLHEHGLDAAAVVEGEVGLAEVDITIEDELARPAATVAVPPGETAAGGEQQDDQHDDDATGHGSPALRATKRQDRGDVIDDHALDLAALRLADRFPAHAAEHESLGDAEDENLADNGEDAELDLLVFGAL